jgi:hypothetical protein
MGEAYNRGLTSRLASAKSESLISKITKAKRAGAVAQAGQHMPSKCEDLTSKPKYYQKNNR